MITRLLRRVAKHETDLGEKAFKRLCEIAEELDFDDELEAFAMGPCGKATTAEMVDWICDRLEKPRFAVQVLMGDEVEVIEDGCDYNEAWKTLALHRAPYPDTRAAKIVEWEER